MNDGNDIIPVRDSAGRWLKGQSGSPGGRMSNEKKELRAYAREFSREAVDGLVSVLRNEKASDVAKVRAAEVLLDRGFGKAPVEVKLDADEDLTALLSALHLDNTGLRALAALMELPALAVLSVPVAEGDE